MKIPKYVIDLMERARYEFDFYRNNENYSAGYTIKIRKYSAYEQADTLRAEIERLIKWVNRQCEDSGFIIDCPTKTHHYSQVAVVTIYDPVMKYIEKYIPKDKWI